MEQKFLAHLDLARWTSRKDASSPLTAPIDQARAERIARGHPCSRCLEYSFKKLVVKPAAPSAQTELGTAWIVTRSCGVCGLHAELALDAEGDIVYG